MTRFGYPFRWYYSSLAALEYFRSASLHDGTPPDGRLADAIQLVRAKRRDDGTWLQELRHGGRAWVELDAAPGEPSKWLTFHAVRVLDWWDSGRA